MNPFALRGPEFLLFYGLLGTATLAALWMLRRQRESQAPASRLHLTDPYLIAYLRGGANEALRVATVSLLDRGLLDALGTRLQASPDAARAVTSPLEKAILRRFETGAEAAAMFDDSTLAAATGPLAETLSRHGLLPDDDALRARRSRALLGIGLMAGVAVVKIAVALSRGRSNVGFLVLLAGTFAFLVWKIAFPPRTPLGEQALQELRSLFGGVRTSGLGLAGPAVAESAMIAAVLGMSVLPASHQAHRLYPKAAESASSGSTWDSSSGSSCSSSSGDSGGGGGCGGGGGGCGGCGS